MTSSPLPYDRRAILLAALFAMGLVIVCGGIGLYVLAAPEIKVGYELAITVAEINRAYTDPVDLDRIVNAGRRGMFERLDQYSFYIPPVNMDRMREEFTGSYAGIGVTVVRDARGLRVVRIKENGPARAAGLLIGDIILADSATIGHDGDTSDLLTVLRGEPGDSVTINVFRKAVGDTIAITLPRQTVKLEHMPFAGITPDNKLYMMLEDFETGAADDVKAAIDSLIIKNDQPPDGIILDLRGNPGGRVYQAIHTADLFLNEGQLIVGTSGRSRWSEQKSYSTGEDMTNGLPMVVMVDNESASAAEIVAGALQQLGRAELVGDTTYGKGLVQGYSGFPDGSGVRLTIARYYLAGGLYLNEFDSTLHETGSGLVPDIFHQFEWEQPFVRQLENSFLLYDFAAIHNDSLIAEVGNGTLSDRWLNLFADFCGKEGFVYNSATTEQAKYLLDLAVAQNANKQITAAAHDLLIDAELGDINQFVVYGDYIKRRLFEIAWERRFGAFAAWLQINLPRNNDIAFAGSVIDGEN